MAARECRRRGELGLDRDCSPPPPASRNGAADVSAGDGPAKVRGERHGSVAGEEDGAARLPSGSLPASWLNAVAAAQSAFLDALSEADPLQASSSAPAPAGSPDLRAAATAAAMAAAVLSPQPAGAKNIAKPSAGTAHLEESKVAWQAPAPAPATRRRRPRQRQPAVVAVSLVRQPPPADCDCRPTTGRRGPSTPLPHAAPPTRARTSPKSRRRGGPRRVDADGVAQRLFAGAKAGPSSRGAARPARAAPSRYHPRGGGGGTGVKARRAGLGPAPPAVPLTAPPTCAKGPEADAPQPVPQGRQTAGGRPQARPRGAAAASWESPIVAPPPSRAGEDEDDAVAAWTAAPAAELPRGYPSPRRRGKRPARARRSGPAAHERLFRQQTTASQRREAEVAARRARFARWKQRVASGVVPSRTYTPALSPHPDERSDASGAAPPLSLDAPAVRAAPARRSAPERAAAASPSPGPGPLAAAAAAMAGAGGMLVGAAGGGVAVPPGAPPSPPLPPAPPPGALSGPDSARWQQWKQRWARWYRYQWQLLQQHVLRQWGSLASPASGAALAGEAPSRRRLYEPSWPDPALPGARVGPDCAEEALGRADDFEAVEQAVAAGGGGSEAWVGSGFSDASTLTAAGAGSDGPSSQRIDRSPYGPPIPASAHWGAHSPQTPSPPPAWIPRPSGAERQPPRHTPHRGSAFDAAAEQASPGDAASSLPLRPAGTRAAPQCSWLQLQLTEPSGDGTSLQSAGRASAMEASATEPSLHPDGVCGRMPGGGDDSPDQANEKRGEARWTPETASPAVPSPPPHATGTQTQRSERPCPASAVRVTAAAANAALPPTHASLLDSEGGKAPARAFSGAEDVGREPIDSDTTVSPARASPLSAFAFRAPDPEVPPATHFGQGGGRSGGERVAAQSRAAAASPLERPAGAAHANRLTEQYQRLRGLLASVRSSEQSPFSPEKLGQHASPRTGRQLPGPPPRPRRTSDGEGCGVRGQVEVDAARRGATSPAEAGAHNAVAPMPEGEAAPAPAATAAASEPAPRHFLPTVPTLLEPPPEWEAGGSDATASRSTGGGGRWDGASYTASSEAVPAWDAEDAACRRERRLLAWQRVAGTGTSTAASPVATRRGAAVPPPTPAAVPPPTPASAPRRTSIATAGASTVGGDSGRDGTTPTPSPPADHVSLAAAEGGTTATITAAEKHPASSLSGLIAAARAGGEVASDTAFHRARSLPHRRASDATALDQRSTAARQRIRRLSSLIGRAPLPSAD